MMLISQCHQQDSLMHKVKSLHISTYCLSGHPKYLGRHRQHRRTWTLMGLSLVAFAFLPVANRPRARLFGLLCVMHSSSVTISQLLNRWV